jgi:hypothetical protein
MFAPVAIELSVGYGSTPAIQDGVKLLATDLRGGAEKEDQEQQHAVSCRAFSG